VARSQKLHAEDARNRAQISRMFAADQESKAEAEALAEAAER